MKKSFIMLFVLAIHFTGFSQQTNPAPVLTKQDYLKKSKNQKTTAWILLGSGTALVIGGGLANAHEIYDPNSFERSYSDKGTPFVITGLAAMAGSIPFFIASSKNKKNAMSMSFRNEPAIQIFKNSFVYRSVPSLSLKLCL